LAAGLFVSQLSAAMLSPTDAALVARLIQFHRYTAEDGENPAPSAVQAGPPDLGEYTHQVLG
jgi:hypothetical protein